LLRDLKNPRNHKEFNEWLSKTFRSCKFCAPRTSHRQCCTTLKHGN
jgi:hypothetical protein